MNQNEDGLFRVFLEVYPNLPAIKLPGVGTGHWANIDLQAVASLDPLDQFAENLPKINRRLCSDAVHTTKLAHAGRAQIIKRRPLCRVRPHPNHYSSLCRLETKTAQAVTDYDWKCRLAV